MHRLDKLVCCSTAVLCPDVAFLPETLTDNDDGVCIDKRKNDVLPISKTTQLDTIAVEIKPKQGWMNKKMMGDGNCEKCRFCLLQYVKVCYQQ